MALLSRSILFYLIRTMANSLQARVPTRVRRQQDAMGSPFDYYQRVKANFTRAIAGHTWETGWSALILVLSAVVFMVIGGVFLINFPVESIIVILLIGSIMVMERG
jgi:hypothetical protein